MGSIWARALPGYLYKWAVPYVLRPGWETRSRNSGGFNTVKGIGIHHDASSKGGSADAAFQWSCFNCPSKPVGNGSLGRDGVFQLWAAGASNTMGQGGPLWTQRGVIAQNDGNATMFAIEAGNSGTGEPWTSGQISTYPRLCMAVIDWANHETTGPPMAVGDIFSHWEYCMPSTPGRKIDPAGPSPWLPSPSKAPHYPDIWDMDKFRASVFALTPTPPQPQPPSGDWIMVPRNERILDTRDPKWGVPRFGGNTAHRIKVPYPGSTQAMVHLQAVNPAGDGFFVVGGVQKPNTAMCGFKGGAGVMGQSLCFTGVDPDGTFQVWCDVSGADLIIDLQGTG